MQSMLEKCKFTLRSLLTVYRTYQSCANESLNFFGSGLRVFLRKQGPLIHVGPYCFFMFPVSQMFLTFLLLL
jgi:hypothetical protein